MNIVEYVVIDGVRYAVPVSLQQQVETNTNKYLALPPEAYLGEVL